MTTVGRANGVPTVFHPVCCPYCERRFDLFAASWCPHREVQASKICPHCTRCLCEHPSYTESLFWMQAPAGFKKRGFQHLFVLYL